MMAANEYWICWLPWRNVLAVKGCKRRLFCVILFSLKLKTDANFALSFREILIQNGGPQACLYYFESNYYFSGTVNVFNYSWIQHWIMFFINNWAYGMIVIYIGQNITINTLLHVKCTVLLEDCYLKYNWQAQMASFALFILVPIWDKTDTMPQNKVEVKRIDYYSEKCQPGSCC